MFHPAVINKPTSTRSSDHWPFNAGKLTPWLIFFTLIAMLSLAEDVVADENKRLRIVSAQTATDTGVIDALINDFKKDNQDVTVEVKTVGALTALDYGRLGRADLVITHVPSGEKLFTEGGYGTDRITFMYNEFIIAGPPNDRLKIASEKDLVTVLKRLAKEQVTFYASGSRSGTSQKLDSLWLLAGVTPDWVGYEATSTSSRATLENAALFQAYTFVDLGTYQVMRELLHDQIVPLYRDNALLRNYYSAIVVNRERVPNVNQPLAESFLNYLASDRAQALIRRFGDEKYGAQIFIPAAGLDEGLQARQARDELRAQARQMALLVASIVFLFFAILVTYHFLRKTRKIEMMRRRSEERFALAVAGSNDGIWDWDILSDRAFFSTQLNNILGLATTEEYVNNPRQILGEIIHPDDRESVISQLAAYLDDANKKNLFLCEFRIQHSTGTVVWLLMRGKAIRGPFGNAVRMSGSVADMTDRKRQEAAIAHMAMHDALTGLPNRTLLHDRLQQALQSASRHSIGLALIMMDLDRFKEINDTLGHQVGDDILRQVSQRLTYIVRPTDTVARLGGDEFAVLLPQADAVYANHVAQKILLALKKVFDLGHHSLYIGSSLGVALFPEHGDDAETLTRHADVAMYNAKRLNSGCTFYNPQQDTHSVERLALEKDLHDAIQEHGLDLNYQPLFDLRTGELVCVEALLRWKHPEHGMISPEKIITIAEQTGQIKALTNWVLNTAIYQCYDWRRKGIEVRLSINLSVWNLHDPELVTTIREAVDTLGIPPSKLELEITESAMMADTDLAIMVLGELHDMGISLAIDDFGTGFSSLAYLKKLPVDKLKIDKSFVMGMSEDDDDVTIVRSTIELAHNLGLKVVAEGIESEAIVKLLQQWGCDFGQGYYFSRPVPLADLQRLLQQKAVNIRSI
ncbi:MAG: EAL domain-containing protein [Pseudomonadota bacterium]